MLVDPRGGCWNTVCHLFAHLLVCCMSPKQVWSQHLAAGEPSCFLSVTCHREALYGLGVQGVKALFPLGVVFLPSCGSSVSAKFLIYAAHAVCSCTLVTILDPPHDECLSGRVPQAICPGWLWTTNLLISAFWVARIIGVSHQCLAIILFLKERLSSIW
jgi:hypothetical protein